MEELVEHVDEHDRVIEIVTRRRMRAENLRHRSVAIIVHSSDGRLLVHRRSPTKDLYPGWWDIAAGGVVGVGEAFADAARRELAEELGIDAEPRWVGTGRHDGDAAREICHVFAVTHDGPYRFDDGEVVEARLVNAGELAALAASAPVLPGSVAIVSRHLDPAYAAALGAGMRRSAVGDGGRDHVPSRSVQRVEFTIEPFVEGQPGRHVTAPVDAVRALGLHVEFGPFGSECSVPAGRAGEVVAAVVDAALANGATHVTIDISADPDTPGADGADGADGAETAARAERGGR